MPLVTFYALVGQSAAALSWQALRLRRAWDEATWPRSNRGYAGLRSAIPAVGRLRDLSGV